MQTSLRCQHYHRISALNSNILPFYTHIVDKTDECSCCVMGVSSLMWDSSLTAYVTSSIGNMSDKMVKLQLITELSVTFCYSAYMRDAFRYCLAVFCLVYPDILWSPEYLSCTSLHVKKKPKNALNRIYRSWKVLITFVDL